VRRVQGLPAVKDPPLAYTMATAPGAPGLVAHDSSNRTSVGSSCGSGKGASRCGPDGGRRTRAPATDGVLTEGGASAASYRANPTSVALIARCDSDASPAFGSSTPGSRGPPSQSPPSGPSHSYSDPCAVAVWNPAAAGAWGPDGGASDILRPTATRPPTPPLASVHALSPPARAGGAAANADAKAGSGYGPRGEGVPAATVDPRNPELPPSYAALDSMPYAVPVVFSGSYETSGLCVTASCPEPPGGSA
jgi:hypothetical protein